jgi:hypothetical protein
MKICLKSHPKKCFPVGSSESVDEWQATMSIIYGKRVRLRAVEREDVEIS